MSEGVRVFGDAVGEEDRGAESAERERRGSTSSGGPRGRLKRSDKPYCMRRKDSTYPDGWGNISGSWRVRPA